MAAFWFSEYDSYYNNSNSHQFAQQYEDIVLEQNLMHLGNLKNCPRTANPVQAEDGHRY